MTVESDPQTAVRTPDDPVAANETDDPPIAHVIVYMDAETRYDGRPHPISDPLGLPVGAPFEHELLPDLPI
jgi:phytanoyl-CoA hydroxylase